MVKNSGGNKSKKQARKSAFVQPNASQNIRYVIEDGEMYAIITKIYGGKTCQVMCQDGISRRCTIRKKFTMARRTSNMISLGSWLMVGLYDWEKRSDGTNTCDILEIYSPSEKEKLKQTVNSKLLKYINEVSNEFDGIKEGSELLFSETLANIDINNNDDGDDDDDHDDDRDDDDAIPIPFKDIPVISESANKQTDWLKIDEDDI